jgi:Zn-dependent protease with chaperone function
VIVGVALLLYAVLMGFLGPLALRRHGRLMPILSRAPRLGAALLLAASWSVLTALFLAGLAIALPGTVLSSGLSDLIGACILRLRAAYATPGGAAVAGFGLTLSGTIALRASWALIRGVRNRRSERVRQRLLIAVAGRRMSSHEAVIVDQPQPAVYCLGGRDRTVILTSGTLDVLTEPQLAAVFAHEHAHLRARHHRLLAAAAVAAYALPELPLMSALPQQVRGLLEMHADDLAASAHDPETLATALVAVATSQPSAPSVAPVATLAAADTDAVARIRRLLLPSGTLSGRRRTTVRAAVVVLALIPALIALTPAAVAANQPPVARNPAVAAVHPIVAPQTR